MVQYKTLKDFRGDFGSKNRRFLRIVFNIIFSNRVPIIYYNVYTCIIIYVDQKWQFYFMLKLMKPTSYKMNNNQE